MDTITTVTTRRAAPKASGADLKTAKPGSTLRFGGGLYCIVSLAGTCSWQVNYTAAGKHKAAIIGRWPEVSVADAKAARERIRQTVRAGGDPAQDRQDARAARQLADATTVRVVGEKWLARAQVARSWSADYAAHTALRMANHVYPRIGDRAVARVTTQDIEELVHGLADGTETVKGKPTQAVLVKQNLAGLYDYALRHDLVPFNPVRKIMAELPKRVTGEEEGRAHVETVADARAILAAVEAGTGTPFAKLAHRLIALTATRKLEAAEARWSELEEAPDGSMVWTIPGARMKGRRGAKHEHVIPLSAQAADVFKAARALAQAWNISSPLVFPGTAVGGGINRSTLNSVMDAALAGTPLAGRQTVHGWRATFSTIMNEADPLAERMIEVMLAHKTLSEVAGRYNKAKYLTARRDIAAAWAWQLLAGLPSAWAVAGLADPASNVVPLREAA